MAMSGGKDDGSPMMEMNTTPLIDVMLVLLIMFIITIPVATHSVNIDLPAAQAPPNPPPMRSGEEQAGADHAELSFCGTARRSTKATWFRCSRRPRR